MNTTKKEITKLLLKGHTCSVCGMLRKCKFYHDEYYCGPEPVGEGLHSRREHRHHPPLPEEGVCVHFKKREFNINFNLSHTHTIEVNEYNQIIF